MKNPCFYYVRHGQTDWNLAGRCQGHTDIPLNQTGVAQARDAAQSLADKPISLIVSSPLQRALKTAEIVAEITGTSIVLDADFKERYFGSFEGKYSKKLKEEHNIPHDTSITTILPPDAEQWSQTLERSWQVVNKWLNARPEDLILFVGHGAVFRALYEQLLGTRLEARNAVPYYFWNEGEAWQVR